MSRIGFVGAGAATAAAAFALDGAAPDAELVVLEKSRGVCGRAATRRRGDLTYDYGANYVKADDERVTDLLTGTLSTDGLVDVTDPIYTFDADGRVSPGRDADEHKWSYERGLTQIAKRLFGRTDATVHRETRVEHVERSGERWRVRDAGGTSWGPFDALCLNPPAPQTAALLGDADWDAPLRDELVAAAREIPFRPIWTAVLHYPFGLDRPYYALVNPGKDHAVGWVAREECKRGHVPDGESLLVVQAGAEWSRALLEDSPAENVARLAALTADVLGDERLADPDWTDHQAWRYAHPESAMPGGLVDAARDRELYLLGDWVAGEARLHAALRNGLETGEKIASAMSAA
ncbi:MAG: NAD(P)/FAD-dependent oxidoreductase [Haloarculaceae archaeon]